MLRQRLSWFWGHELELQFADAVGTTVRDETCASQECQGGGVVGECARDELVDRVRAGALDYAGEQLAADATPLPVVDNLACELSYAICLAPRAIARYADDRPVGWVDRDESLVPDVVDI